MKKIIVYLVVFIILIMVVCYCYFNSQQYLNRTALKNRAERLSYLDNLPRTYINEGVYSFEYTRKTQNTIIDKYGEFVTNPSKDFNGEGEFSYNRNRIVLLANEIREELQLGPALINTKAILNEKITEYEFPIIKWQAYRDLTGICIFSYENIPKLQNKNEIVSSDDPVIHFLSDSYPYNNQKDPPGIAIYQSGFLLDEINLLHGFICTQGEETIKLIELKYQYNNGLPYLLTNAKYSPHEYDLDSYIFALTDRHRKNPFIDKQIK
jgi:hypothetical protein